MLSNQRTSGLWKRIGLGAAVGAGLALTGAAHGQVILSEDDFESYDVGNPAADPLEGTSATWHYVGTPDINTANAHRIWDAPAWPGAELDSRVWLSWVAGAGIENSVSLADLAGTEFEDGSGNILSGTVFEISFMAASESADEGRTAPFDYEINSSAGSLQFIEGGNRSGDLVFSGLSEINVPAVEGNFGKGDPRLFDISVSGDGLTVNDEISFAFFYSVEGVPDGDGDAFLAFDDFSMTAVPEPGSLALLGMGGLMLLRRRRH